ncbi:MAG TPA: hypothetical protein VGD69_21660, partial [Herpetosiphonaceae bacterium]
RSFGCWLRLRLLLGLCLLAVSLLCRRSRRFDSIFTLLRSSCLLIYKSAAVSLECRLSLRSDRALLLIQHLLHSLIADAALEGQHAAAAHNWGRSRGGWAVQGSSFSLRGVQFTALGNWRCGYRFRGWGFIYLISRLGHSKLQYSGNPSQVLQQQYVPSI